MVDKLRYPKQRNGKLKKMLIKKLKFISRWKKNLIHTANDKISIII